jgi:hypothetical protein
LAVAVNLRGRCWKTGVGKEEMHYHEIDFRRDWLGELFHALTAAINNISERIKKDDYFDETFAREHSETILGIAFIAAQTYIAGTVADINAILGKSKQLKRDQLLALDVVFIKNGITRLELIDAIANYHKHHDEWETWKPNRRNQSTIDILNKCEITEETEFPCYSAATRLWPPERLGEFGYLLDALVAWRERVFRENRPGTGITEPGSN